MEEQQKSDAMKRSARFDFVLLMHWCQLVDQTFVLAATSLDETKTEQRKGYVRSRLVNSGWVVKPMPGTTSQCRVINAMRIIFPGEKYCVLNEMSLDKLHVAQKNQEQYVVVEVLVLLLSLLDGNFFFLACLLNCKARIPGWVSDNLKTRPIDHIQMLNKLLANKKARAGKAGAV